MSKEGSKLSEECKKRISETNKESYKKRIEKGLGPTYQAFGKDNPACRPEVRKQISNTVKKLWADGRYEKRINGMLGKSKHDIYNYSPLTERKYKFRKYLQKFQPIVCSICGEKEKKIDIHHVDENHLNFLLTNLEPLCVLDHRLFHLNVYRQPYATITKMFKMECAHKLELYDGPCGRYHGHSYHFSVTIRKRLNPKTGMVMDFGELKNIVNKYIVKELDHFDINTKMPFQTTSENMIFWMWKQLEEKAFLKGMSKIELYETDTSKVTLKWDDVLEYEKSLIYKTSKDTENEKVD